MDLTFERGDSLTPKGHALVYFRVKTEEEKVYVTYVVVLPVSVDFSKYVPPFLASHIGSIPADDFSAFALPPVPEEISSYKELERLAVIRDDDLVYAGSIFSFDIANLMQLTGDVVKEYSQRWLEYSKCSLEPMDDSQNSGGLGVSEVLYGMMTEGDRLGDLSKLISRLRFAVEGKDSQMTSEIEEEIDLLARHLPEHFDIDNLVQAVMDSSLRGGQLAKLYIDRCYKLSSGDQAGVLDLESKIQALEAVD